MTAADFTRQQFDWLAAISDDVTVPANAFRLAFVIGRHINRQTGDAWPTQETLAKHLNMTPRAIRRLAEALRDAGHLAIVESHKRGQSNHYMMLFKSPSNRTELSGINDDIGDNPVRYNDAHTGQDCPINRTELSGDTGPNCPINPYIEPFEEPFPTSSGAKAPKSALDEDPKAVLFGDGLTWLSTTSGKSSASTRSMLGQCLKLMRDDADAVLAIVRYARRRQVADPVRWIMGACKSRSPLKAVAPSAPPAHFQPLSKPAARA